MSSPRASAAFVLTLTLSACATAPHNALAPIPPAFSRDVPALGLAQWTEAAEAAEAALAITGPGSQVRACEAWVQRYRAHPLSPRVLEAWARRLAEIRPLDVDALLHVLGVWADAAPLEDDVSLRIIEDFFLTDDLPVDLPLASGLSLLGAVEDRHRGHMKTCAPAEAVAHQEALFTLALTRARLTLKRGTAEGALAAVEEARAAMEAIPSGLLCVGEGGKPLRTLSLGKGDPVVALKAAALLAAGDRAGAMETAGRWMGTTQMAWAYDLFAEVARSLGLPGPVPLEVKTAAKLAPELSFPDLEGAPMTLSQYRGQVVLLSFWASWCGPCLQELPILQRVVADYEQGQVALVGVNLDTEFKEGELATFMEKKGLSFPNFVPGAPQVEGYPLLGIPAFYVIGPDGRIVHSDSGMGPDFEVKLRAFIDEALAHPEVPPETVAQVIQAPEGFGIRWSDPEVKDIGELKVFSPLESGAPGGVVAQRGRDLLRWSPDGTREATMPGMGFLHTLASGDLDHDGGREWVVGGYMELRIQDDAGAEIWSQPSGGRWFLASLWDRVPGQTSLILRERAGVHRAFPGVPVAAWESRLPPEPFLGNAVTGSGQPILQSEGDLYLIEADGTLQPQGLRPPEGRSVVGRALAPGWDDAWFFGGSDLRGFYEDLDIDGDGEVEVLLEVGGSILILGSQGEVRLHLRRPGWDPHYAIGDMDGLPGDELALYVDGAGLFVFGLGAEMAIPDPRPAPSEGPEETAEGETSAPQ